jgi:iron complex transport system ATP-binding protein
MSLQALEISFRYGPRFGIAGVSLGVPDGAWLGIIGSNGSGKSTTLRVLAGLIRPDRGEVLLDGEPLHRYHPNRRARHLAFVPQAYQPAFEFTVEQTVLMGRMPYSTGFSGFETDEDRAIASEAIALLELEDLRNEPVTKLSGGELQRVVIARALAQSPRNVLLDEPTAHLDIAHQQDVMHRLRERVDRGGLSIVSTIHDLNLAALYCDSIVALRGGRIVKAGATEDVLRTDVLRAVFGVELVVEQGVYGNAPSIRYAQRREDPDAT